MKFLLPFFLILTLLGPIYISLFGNLDFQADWRTANRESAHIAPDPKVHHEAIIQIYSAPAFNWRGVFAVHCWIATKAKNAAQFTVYQVVGWRTFWHMPPLLIEEDIPDRFWFGQKPTIIRDIRGDEAEKWIPEIHRIAEKYPYANDYALWPGPNSNTFPAYLARQLPGLHLALPPTAVGKDYLSSFSFFAKAPSGTGYQFSLFGILGILIAKEEGLEINFMGLVYGINFKKKAIILPGIGAVSFS